MIKSAKNLIHNITHYALMAGMGWVLVMMLLTTCDVILRYCFSQPIPGAKALNEFMLALFGILGMAYTQQTRGNVRVTVLLSALPPRVSAVTESITHLLSVVITLLIAWQAGVTGTEEFHNGTTSDTPEIPVYPFKFLLAAGAFFLCLELIVNFVETVAKLKAGSEKREVRSGK